MPWQKPHEKVEGLGEIECGGELLDHTQCIFMCFSVPFPAAEHMTEVGEKDKTY